MAKTVTTVEHTKLSDQAIQLINELWDVMSMVYSRDVTGAEIKAETEIGSRTMDEYEFHLRQKLLKYRTDWKSTPMKSEPQRPE
jgi:hypothetical protein